MKTTNKFAFLFLLIAIVACKKDKPYVPVKVCSDISNEKGMIDQHLQGSWKWLEDKAYDRDGSERYNTPKTVGFQETVTINTTQINFLRISKSGIETTTYTYKIMREAENTTIPGDSMWVLSIYDSSLALRNWWRVYVCQNNLILANAYKGEVYPDRTYKRN